MPATYNSIANIVLTGGAKSVTFSSIPGTYTDLRLVFSGSTDNTASPWPSIELTFNNSTTSYSYSYLDGYKSGKVFATSTSGTNINAGACKTGYNMFSVIDIFSYAGSGNKACLGYASNNDAGSSGVVFPLSGLWRSSAAITSIKLTVGNTNGWSSGNATLYGILAA